MSVNTLPPVSGKFLTYKGKPLVREGNTICYGDRNVDACLLILDIISTKKVGNEDVPDGIFIQIVDSKNPMELLKQGEKQTLTEAFSVGLIWFERYSKKKNPSDASSAV
jgi:hypothetical protein